MTAPPRAFQELQTSAEARATDVAAAAMGVDTRALMEAAGEAVARLAIRLGPDGPIVVLCGPGANGGDGFVAARHLAAAGRPVRLFLLPPRTGALSGDAAWAAGQWAGPAEPWPGTLPPDTGLVIDAVFGAGFRGTLPVAVDGLLAEAVRRKVPVLSVDVPSGVMDDGAVACSWIGAGPQAVATTITFHRPKPVHVLRAGPLDPDRVEVADIGIPAAAQVSGSVVWNRPAVWADALPWPGVRTHKHARGRLAVLSGPALSTGAARLAARAGARAGAGWVTLHGEAAAMHELAMSETSVMTRVLAAPSGWPDLGGPVPDAVVAGPALGTGQAQGQQVQALLDTAAGTLVLDADALGLMAGAPDRVHPAPPGSTRIVTPHGGEFARLCRAFLPGQSAGSSLQAARKLSERLDAIVVLKGADTWIVHPDGRTALNTHATPWLASAGTGDVLAGLIGGLAAQGMAPFLAACAGVWLHGEAGLRAGAGLMAEDLPGVVADVLDGLAPPALRRRHP